MVTKLAKSNEIQAAVVLHPGPISVDDINGNLLLCNVLFEVHIINNELTMVIDEIFACIFVSSRGQGSYCHIGS